MGRIDKMKNKRTEGLTKEGCTYIGWCTPERCVNRRARHAPRLRRVALHVWRFVPNWPHSTHRLEKIASINILQKNSVGKNGSYNAAMIYHSSMSTLYTHVFDAL